jgi:hypothetical protein
MDTWISPTPSGLPGRVAAASVVSNNATVHAASFINAHTADVLRGNSTDAESLIRTG